MKNITQEEDIRITTTDIVDENFQNIYREIVKQIPLKAGDIDPVRSFRINEIREDLVETLINWIVWNKKGDNK